MKNQRASRNTVVAVVLSLAAAAGPGMGAAAAADVGPSASAIASVDRAVRSFLAAHLSWAGQQLGLDVDATGLGYASTPEKTLAGGIVRGPLSMADLRSGAPFMLWYVERRGSREPGYYTASLAPDGAAVLKDSRGGEVARGTAQLGFKATGPAGYCQFDPVPGSDNVCLNCSTNFPGEFGGPFNWSVCFAI